MAETPIVGRRRWAIGLLLGAGILINYFDRVNISVAAPQLQQEFGLTPGDLGCFSAPSSGPTPSCRSRSESCSTGLA